jgi:hypothetical protein
VRDPAAPGPLALFDSRLDALEDAVLALAAEIRSQGAGSPTELQELAVDVANLREWLDEQVRDLHAAIAAVATRSPVRPRSTPDAAPDAPRRARRSDRGG